MTLSEFFIKLASDEELARRFYESPSEVIDEADLTEEQKAVLKSGDLRRVRFKIDVELEVEGEKTALIVIWWLPIWWGSGEGPEGEGGSKGGKPGSAA